MKTHDINDVIQVLKNQETAAFLTSGASMRPLLRTHKDIVVIKKAEHPLKVGQVPLYQKAGVDKLILHRIIGIKDDKTYITRGDNTYHKEYIAHSDVVGVMCAVYRGGKYIDCDTSKQYNIYVKINRFFYPVRFVYKKIRTILGKIKRNLIKR